MSSPSDPSAPQSQPRRQYEQAREQARREAEGLGARSRRIANARGVSFALVVCCWAWAGLADGGVWGWALGSVALVAFVAWIVLHDRVMGAEDLAWRRHQVAHAGVLRCTGEWQSLPDDGAQFQDDAHPYSSDLDLFGPRSLYQLLCTAHTPHGQQTLAGALKGWDGLERVRARQQAVRRLVGETTLRQEIEVLSLPAAGPPDAPKSKRQTEALKLEPLLAWAEAGPAVSSQPALVWAARLLPPLTLAVFVAIQLSGISWAWLLLPLLAQAVVMMRALPAANVAFAAVSATPGGLKRLRPALARLERAQFDEAELRRIWEALHSDGIPVSRQMSRLDRVVGWFELRHNGMVYPFVNLVFLYDVHCVVALEDWQRRSGRQLAGWLQALGDFEVLSALATAAYDQTGFCFPQLEAAPAHFEAEGLGHPLIEPAKRVTNGVALAEPGRALLVTGSNMSGKSTLLRSMGLAVVLALAGGPVCATRLRLGPVALSTSLRIRDSLAEGVSHFYAELQKLSATLEATRGDRAVFFLLDEILHGTNSEERQVGARWVLGELLRAGALGAVSTHDLGLCQLPPELMQRVETVHLRETVEGERMSFDYRLRPGPVRGGNALRLMRGLGLGVPLVLESPGRSA